jgi:hypothetical protein
MRMNSLSCMSSPSSPPAPPHTRLQEIADALGISPDQLRAGQASPFVDGALDLVRLYATISDLQGRQRVLNIARREAERSEEAPPPPGIADPGRRTV